MSVQASVVVVGAMLALVCLCGSASAAIYWGNHTTIGRMNLDGTYLLDSYIGNNGDGTIGGTCGVAVDGSHIYWGEPGRGWIGRANLDGSDPESALISGASEPCGVAVDASYIYWTNGSASTIGRARLDGTDVRQDFVKIPTRAESPFAVPRPCGIAVNGAHIYWANWRGDFIGRASLDGETVTENFIETEESGPCGVAVNSTHVFWGSYSTVIGRADLDGANAEDNFITGLERPCGVAVGGSHLYWIEQGGRRYIGRANLDGSSLIRDLATEVQADCGIAVDSLYFTPPPGQSPPPPPPAPAPAPAPPPPAKSLCELGTSRHDRRTGSLSIAVHGPAGGRVKVLTRGLRSRLLTRKAPVGASSNSRWWWIKVWPRRKGKVAKRIRHHLARDGRVKLRLRVRCSSGGTPTSTSRRIALVAKRAKSQRPGRAFAGTSTVLGPRQVSDELAERSKERESGALARFA